MDLKTVNLKLKYRSSDSDILSDFYIPCLSNATLYRRAVGYFTSNGLTLAAKGISRLCKNNGSMQLIASPHLNDDDITAINNGYSNAGDIVLKCLLNVFENIPDETVLNRLTLLSALIAEGRLEIKLALRVKNGRYQNSLYHEKIGVFTDEHFNRVAFVGSANETTGGLIDNFESIQVFKGWSDSDGRVDDIAHDFDLLWNNETNGIAVIPFPDAARNHLLKVTSQRRADVENLDEIDFDSDSNCVSSPTFSSFTPRDYQLKAVSEWVANGYSGLFKMATGTGKTKTALYAVRTMATDIGRLLVVVVVPFQHLVDQWSDECEMLGYRTIRCCSSYSGWKELLNDLRMDFLGKEQQVRVAVTTYDTFSSQSFLDIVNRFTCSRLLIADEVHQMGAESYRISLERFKGTLGLSATPERIYDPEGTQWIFDAIGPVVFEFGLAEAICKGFLCRYNYHVHVVNFTDAEMNEYYEVMEQIAKACAKGAALHEESSSANSSLGPLLRRRQELIGAAAGKLPALRAEIARIQEKDGPFALNSTLVYASSENFDEIMQLLSVDIGLKLTRFTFRENIVERRQILDDFSNKRIKVILAKKCLDMGVDIPATKNAFILASSSNPMEFIQRRGRVLRPYAGKTHAEIHDFFVLPPHSYRASKYDVMLVERELKRAIEFSQTASNYAQCHSILSEIADRYDLHHL